MMATTKPKDKSKKKEKKDLKVKELGTLKPGNKKIHLVALPSNAKSVVVNYSSHEMRVSCAIPPEKQTIAIKSPYGGALEPFKFKTLATILTAEYTDFPQYGRANQPIKSYYLFSYNTRVKKWIAAAPYLISNVYKGGRICFGKLNPSNLREAYNYFWNSTFNNELHHEHIKAVNYTGSNDLKTYSKNYHKTIFLDQPWEDFTPFICGRKFWAAPRGGDALLFSNDPWILGKIPKKFWRRNTDGYPFVVALANLEDDYYEIDGGLYTFKLPAKNVTTQKQYSKKCQKLKKKFAKAD